MNAGKIQIMEKELATYDRGKCRSSFSVISLKRNENKKYQNTENVLFSFVKCYP